MSSWRNAALAIGLAILTSATPAAERSKAARAEFIRLEPCPETGITRGACPGWQVDHTVPLCAGGADHPDNMQWLATDKHKAKTKKDVAACRFAVIDDLGHGGRR